MNLLLNGTNNDCIQNAVLTEPLICTKSSTHWFLGGLSCFLLSAAEAKIRLDFPGRIYIRSLNMVFCCLAISQRAHIYKIKASSNFGSGRSGFEGIHFSIWSILVLPRPKLELTQGQVEPLELEHVKLQSNMDLRRLVELVRTVDQPGLVGLPKPLYLMEVKHRSMMNLPQCQ